MSDFQNLFFDEEFDLDISVDELSSESKYTRNVTIPQYEPSDYCPAISEMMNTDKYAQLVAEINASSVSDDVKRFLRLAAARHVVFNFAKVADFYANSDAEIQRLMENSALVLIDIDNAMANGFAKLDSRLLAIAKYARKEKREREEANKI